VKNVLSCPQRAQNLAEMLELQNGVDELLFITQAYTVPLFVVTKRNDILQRIAQACTKTGSIQDIITSPRKNYASVFARLLLATGDSPQHAIALLQQAAPRLQASFSQMIEVEAVKIGCEILSVAGDWPESRKPKIGEAFNLLVLILAGAGGLSNEDLHPLQAYIEDNGLGIMTHFIDITDNPKSHITTLEKQKAIKSIEQFIVVTGPHIVWVLAQVRDQPSMRLV
jgi:hypothetical protein